MVGRARCLLQRSTNVGLTSRERSLGFATIIGAIGQQQTFAICFRHLLSCRNRCRAGLGNSPFRGDEKWAVPAGLKTLVIPSIDVVNATRDVGGPFGGKEGN